MTAYAVFIGDEEEKEDANLTARLGRLSIE